MKKTALAICFILIGIVGLWIIAIPEGLILDLIEDSIEDDRVYIEIRNFKKGLFYGVTAEEILVMTKDPRIDEDLIFTLDNVKAQLDFMSLLRLRPAVDFDSMLNGGRVTGMIMMTGSRGIKMNGAKIPLAGVPVMESLGLKAQGNMSMDVTINENDAYLTFFVNDMGVRSTMLSGALLPLDMFKNLKGSLSMNHNSIDVKSFTLEGKGVYARLTGRVTESFLDLSMELMMDSSFELSSLLQAALERYQESPGYYVIPIKTVF